MSSNLLYIIWFQIVWHAFSINNIDVDLAAGLPLSQGFQIAGSIAGYNLAFSLKNVGDVNKDGYSDVIVGDHKVSSGKGAAYIIYGQPDGTATNINLNSFPLSQGFSILGGVTSTYFGITVSGAGDVNNDGYDDFIVGADQGNGGTGMVYVFYGGTGSNIDLGNPFSLSQGFTIVGISSGNFFGHSVAFAGDMNKDGYTDIMIGAYGMSSGKGAVYIIYGQPTSLASNIDVSSSLLISQGFKITGSAAGDKLGVFLNSAGDVNQDGYDDVIIGASGFSPTGRSGAGAAYIIYGKLTNQASNINLSATLSLSRGFQIIGSSASDALGSSVNSAGDVNQDGYDDVIIGARGFSPTGRTNVGAAYIIYGKPTNMAVTIDLSGSLSLSQGFQVIGDVAGAYLGYSVSSAGDFDKDGYDDVLIGAAYNDHTGRGTAYIIYGRPENLAANIDLSAPLRLSQGFKIVGVTSADNFGNSASSAGDMNKDGYNDIIIGAPFASPLTRSSAGAAYVIYSQVPPCNTPHCIQCLASRCVACETDFLLYSGDNKCYIYGNCPAGTSSNSTHCIDPAMETLAVAQGSVSQAAGLATSAVTAVSFSNPEGMMFAALSGTLMYMKYINLTFPPKLQYILNQPDFSLISIEDISSPPDQIQDKMPSYVLPDNFQKNGLDSSFLINFWSSLTNLLIIMMAIVVLFLASYLTKSCKFVNTKINKIQESLHWNYLLGTFAGCYGPTAFYSSFQFRTVQFESGLETFSFLICLFTNILLFAILVKTILITTKLMQEKNTNKLKKLKEHLKAYQILFESFKSDSFMHQSYFLLSCVRFYVFYLILAYLYAYPLFQAILISLQGLLFLSYLLIYRPFTSKLDLVGSIIFEVILQVEHACGIGFAIINQSGIETTTHRAVILGNIVIVSISVFIGVQCLYSFVQIVGLAINLFKFIKRRLSPSNAHPPKSGQKYKTSLKKNNRADLEMINEDDSVTMASPFERKKVISPPQPAVLPRNHVQTSFNRLNRVKYNRDEKPDNPQKLTVKKRAKEVVNPIDAESVTNSVNPDARPAMKKNFIRDEINS